MLACTAVNLGVYVVAVGSSRSTSSFAVSLDESGSRGTRENTTPLAVRLSRVKGTHLTPLTQDIFLPASKVADYAATATAVDPLIAAPRGTFLRQVDDAFAELDAWLAGTEAAK